MLIVLELTLIVAFLMVWKGLSLILEEKVLTPARARRWREALSDLDAEERDAEGRGAEDREAADERARLAHESAQEVREASREQAWAEWERDRAELREQAGRLR